MATMTYGIGAGSATNGTTAQKDVARRKSVLARIVAAIQESRMRRAEIEIRRVRAILADNDAGFKDALLPFRGE